MNNEAIKKIAESNGFDEASRQLFEESADVTIMIEQIKYLLSLNIDDIDLFIEQKLNRQLERIEKNE